MRHRTRELQRHQGRRPDRMLRDRAGRRHRTLKKFRVSSFELKRTRNSKLQTRDCEVMHRAERIADTLREEIAQIVGYELEDPRLTMVTVTEVRVADDLRDASVYVTVQGDEHEHELAL